MARTGKARWVKWLVALVVLGVVGGIVFYYATDEDEAPQYQTAVVTRGDLTQVVTASGTLNPVLNVQVGSQISGNIAKLFADFNSLVKSNQVVAQLDPSICQASVHQAEADLANARASLELQQAETRRAELLFKDRLISQSDYDKAQATLHQAEAQVKIKQASLERSKLDLSHCTIYAPVDGIVISRSVDVGQTVAASMNAPVLFQIANDLSNMQIDANVSEADVGTVETGQQVGFTVDAYPNRTFNGRVVQIRNSPVTVQNVVTYDTVIGVTNADFKLKPGMTATVSITTAQRTNVLKVPNAALRFKPPEPSTNQTAMVQLLAKLGLGAKPKPAPTNAAPVAAASGTNQAAAAGASATLTGNEAPEELQRRVREMRERGEEPPAEISAKLRELYRSGVLQRGGQGGRPGGAEGAPSRPRPAASWRTIYIMTTNTPAGGGEPVSTLESVRVRLGITDNSSTEVLSGLKEGDRIVTGVKLSQPQETANAQMNRSPFGGMGRMR